MSERSPKLRLLVVIKSDGVGGVERFLSGMIPAFASRGVEVDLVGHGRPPSSPGLLADHEVATLAVGRLPGVLGRARQALGLRRRIGRHDYAAVIGFGPVASSLVALARRRPGPLTVVTERSDPFIEERRTWNRLFRWTYRRADVLVVQTDAMAAAVRSRWPRPAEVAVIANPVPAGVPICPPSRRRDPVIAGVGRLLAKKGYSDLIAALAQVGPRAEGWSLLLVGDGPERVKLEAQAERLGLGERVVFTGVHPTPWQLLANASIFVLCSRHEAYGNVLLEAMASGCAVVASDCRFGPPAMIDHDVSGLLYPVGDIHGLADHLGALIADPARRLALAEAASHWAARQTTDQAVTSWLELLTASPRTGVRAPRDP